MMHPANHSGKQKGNENEHLLHHWGYRRNRDRLEIIGSVLGSVVRASAN